MAEWEPMATAPRTGSSFDVKCVSKDGVEKVIENLHYAYPPIGRGKMILWGTQNFLSPYMTPLAWRPRAATLVKGNGA